MAHTSLAVLLALSAVSGFGPSSRPAGAVKVASVPRASTDGFDRDYDEFDRDCDDDAPITPIVCCSCGSGVQFDACCARFLVDGESPGTALELLQARYTAHVRGDTKFIVDTTHPTNEAYMPDREAWENRLRSFLKAVSFQGMYVWETDNTDDDQARILWNARMRLLEQFVSEEAVETKDFIERSIFIREGGRWFYKGGDPDWDPRTVTVDDDDDQPPDDARDRRVRRGSSATV